MKRIFQSIATTILVLISLHANAMNNGDVQIDKWRIEQSAKRGITISCGDNVICQDISAIYKYHGIEIDSRQYQLVDIDKQRLSDCIGQGTQLTLHYQHETLPRLDYNIYIYDDADDYCLVEFCISSQGGDIAINYASPINMRGKIVSGESEIRSLFIPYDNDKWVRYRSTPVSSKVLRSYEVTAVYDSKSFAGLVVGSVDHDVWKSAIDVTSSSLTCFGGVADEFTRDVKEHGYLRGDRLKSPQIYISRCDDIRDGLEHYANINVRKYPKPTYSGTMPWGWNSWGALKFDLNYENAIEVSDFIRDNLQNNTFCDENKSAIIWLDSGWNRFSDAQLAQFVEHCRNANQEAGIYWTPFAEWSKRGDRKVKYAEQFSNSDIYLYANGAPQILDNAYAVDPTHPAIEMQIKAMAELFKRHGFKYVKLDFMTHGALESDGWYDKSIETGTQAYNYGMELLSRYFDGLYLNLSISPLFPSHHAHSRRIACDAWNKIKDTEYTMNALSYGWWTSHLYHYNDGDHIVLRDATQSENRARITSGIMTGLYILGDNFSNSGEQQAKQRAKEYLTNPAINAIADGRTFRPVTGDGVKSENHFVKGIDDSSCYYAIYNYSEESITERIDLASLDLRGVKKHTLTELWSGRKYEAKRPTFSITIPPKSVYLFEIY